MNSAAHSQLSQSLPQSDPAAAGKTLNRLSIPQETSPLQHSPAAELLPCGVRLVWFHRDTVWVLLHQGLSGGVVFNSLSLGVEFSVASRGAKGGRGTLLRLPGY